MNKDHITGRRHDSPKRGKLLPLALVITFGLLSLHGCRDNVGGEASLLRQYVGGEASLLRQGVGGEASLLRQNVGGEASLLRQDVGGGASLLRQDVGGEASLLRQNVGGEASLLRQGVGVEASLLRQDVGGKASSFAKTEQSTTAQMVADSSCQSNAMASTIKAAELRRPDMRVRVRRGHRQLCSLTTTMQRSEAGGFRLLPSGRNFSPYAKLRVAYDEARLPFGYTPDDIYTSYYDEPNVYFCHSDHLGSASWITNSHGMPVQHLRYLPYGEPFINQRTSGYSERFTFTGKAPREGNRTPMNKIKYSEERDPETGFSYFGARYYDPDLTGLWLSPDPLSDKYPGISPYAYCAWNPVRLVDPDGKVVSTHTDKDGNVWAVYNDGILGIYVHSDSEVKSFQNGYRFSNNNDQLIGSTLHENSFNAGDKIDFGSNAAEQWLNHFENWASSANVGKKDGVIKYGLLARNKQLFDPKSYMCNGSLISDCTFISPQDLGNYAAGRIGKMLGFTKTEILARYGAFQLAGNNLGKLMFSFRELYEKALNHPLTSDGQRTFGEEPISNYFQRLGYEGINSIFKYVHNYSAIWDD